MKIVVVLILIIFTPLQLQAEDRIGYVTDNLRLKMYENRGEGEELATLQSADRLEILEESGQFYRVRTEEGTVGWAKKFYIVDEPPAEIRLIELQQEADRHIAELEARNSEVASLKTQVETLQENLESKAVGEGLREEYEQQLIQANQENVQLFNEKEQLRKQLDQAALEIRHRAQESPSPLYASVKPLLWLLGSGFTGLLIGMLLGWGMYARKLRRRFYGFKL